MTGGVRRVPIALTRIADRIPKMIQRRVLYKATNATIVTSIGRNLAGLMNSVPDSDCLTQTHRSVLMRNQPRNPMTRWRTFLPLIDPVRRYKLTSTMTSTTMNMTVGIMVHRYATLLVVLDLPYHISPLPVLSRLATNWL